MRIDDYVVLVSTVERAMRRRNLLPPKNIKGNAAKWLKRGKRRLLIPPIGPTRVWQLDFSEFETTTGGVWRIAGCADYCSQCEFGWHRATTCNAIDAELAVRIAMTKNRNPAR